MIESKNQVEYKIKCPYKFIVKILLHFFLHKFTIGDKNEFCTS